MATTLPSPFDLSGLALGLPDHHYSPQARSPLQQHQQRHPAIRSGVVKFFNSSKGFGFVIDSRSHELGHEEVFCHFSAIAGKGGFRSLAEGEEVEYELVQGPKGFQAANLTGPGGRSVVGDPKARLAKPPPYMPFATMSMPPYMSDPYQQHAPNGYGGSPYTQHVLYVPSTLHNPNMSAPTSQYGYSGMPQGSASLASPPGNQTSSFRGSPYQANYGGGYQSLGGLTGPISGSYRDGNVGVGQGQRNGSIPTAFAQLSPPGGHFQSLAGGDQQGPTRSFGYNDSYTPPPFNSPPSFGNPPLFGSNNGLPPTSSPFSSSNLTLHNTHSSNAFSVPSQHQHKNSSSSRTSSSNPLAVGAPGSAGGGGSSLFGTGAIGPSSIVGTPRSSSGTPGGERTERRGTPLGNGSLVGGTSSAFAPILYTTGDYS